MKFEVIRCSGEKTVETYSMASISMFDFQQWKETSHQIIPLSELKGRIAKLDSTDSETNEPNSTPMTVDFYLPDPLRDDVFAHFLKSETNTEESPNQSEKKSAEVTERDFESVLKSSTILSAVITEILENHEQHSHYKVRISDE